MLHLRRGILARLVPSPSASVFSPLHRLLSVAAPAVSPNPPGFAAEAYLVDTCGLTPAQALKASGKISHRKSPSNPDAALAFLAGRLGLSGTDITTLVARDPEFLCARVDRTLTPVIAGLTGLGLSHSDIARLVPLQPNSFRRASLVSKVRYYLSLFGSYDNLLRAIKRRPYLLTSNLEDTVKANVAFLRECGLGACDIAKLCIAKPRILTTHLESVQAMVARAYRLGVPRGSEMFRQMLQVVASLSEENVAVKVEYMKDMFRWSDAFLGIAVSKLPVMLGRSKETLQSRSEFLISEVGLDPAYIAHRPALIMYSLDARLRPRYYVVKLLKGNGLLHPDRDYYSAVTVTDRVFAEKYIIPYAEAAPYLAEDYAAACRGEVPPRFIFA